MRRTLDETRAALRREIGREIRSQRERQRMPLHKLARLAAVRPERLDHYELGKSEITLNDLFRIACALKVAPGRLLNSAG